MIYLLLIIASCALVPFLLAQYMPSVRWLFTYAITFMLGIALAWICAREANVDMGRMGTGYLLLMIMAISTFIGTIAKTLNFWLTSKGVPKIIRATITCLLAVIPFISVIKIIF